MSASLLEELFAKRQLGVKLGLETMQALAEQLGNPQDNLHFIHIAGTNGKGSTAAMLESILRHAGYKVGLFTSPHLVSFCERIQINRVPISEKVLVEFYEKMQPALTVVEAMSDCHNPTFFEITTALALLIFQEEKVDWVIWETGMGGRLDSTNIVQPQLSILTSISFDHKAWLGSTLEEIATEKAGIIKRGVPIISALQMKECIKVIEQKAVEKEAPYVFVEENKISLIKETLEGQIFSYRSLSYSLNLLGEHQRQNAAVVLEAVETLRNRGVEISEKALRRGLETVTWPARFQILQKNRLIILDGAHNEAGIEALVRLYRSFMGETKTNLLFGVLSDKEIEGMINHLLPLVKKAFFIPLTSSRALKPELITTYFSNHDCEIKIFPNFQQAWPFLKSEPLLITGSLYLAGEVLNHFSFEL